MAPWYLLALTALVVLGLQRFLYKVSAEMRCNSAVTTFAFMATVAVLSWCAYLPRAAAVTQFGPLLIISLVNSLGFLTCTLATIEALKALPAGTVYPLTRLSTVLSVLFSLAYFGDRLNLRQGFGVLLALAVIVLLARSRGGGGEVEAGHARRGLLLALLAIGGTGGWVSHAWLGPEAGATQLAEAALTAHGTYVVEVVHPVEVPASQREHLDTWMSKRMGTQMRPPDLAASGFALMGGRILPSEDGPAGLYMYENADGKRITLYVSPQRDKADSAFEYAGHGTTQSLYWKDGGLGYAVVGDMPRDRLRDLAIEAYDQLL